MLTLLYHQVGSRKGQISPELLSEHFSWLAHNAEIVLPGEPLTKHSMCITFDDATLDFYLYVFPLLKHFRLRAQLAVPVSFIHPAKQFSMRTHCCWEELEEMVQSGLVSIASHSIHHRPLTDKGVNIESEIASSKTLLQDRLHIPISTFVYPLGKFNAEIHQCARKHYQWIMRIGTAWNSSWNNWSYMTYRIVCNSFLHPRQMLEWKNTLKYRWFYLINSLRKR